MSKIDPKKMKEIFTEDVLDILPANNAIKKGVANLEGAQNPVRRQKQLAGIKAKQNDPTLAENRLRGIREIRANNPEWRENCRKSRMEFLATEEGKLQRKLIGERQRTDPKFKEACKEGNKARWLKEENLSTCPHCNAKVDNANYDKHHGDNCVFKGKKIACYDGRTKVAEYYSREDVVADGLNYEHVRNCVNGKRDQYKGYTFKWVKK